MITHTSPFWNSKLLHKWFLFPFCRARRMNEKESPLDSGCNKNKIKPNKKHMWATTCPFVFRLCGCVHCACLCMTTKMIDFFFIPLYALPKKKKEIINWPVLMVPFKHMFCINTTKPYEFPMYLTSNECVVSFYSTRYWHVTKKNLE